MALAQAMVQWCRKNMNREIVNRSMWVWSPRGESAKIKTTKFSSGGRLEKLTLCRHEM
jgi:hypothetical protein